MEIIHECARHWDGIPTNNNGDRYLLVWRLPTMNDVKKNVMTNLSSAAGEGDKEGEEKDPMAAPSDPEHEGE